MSLAAATELDKKQLALWKKHMKAAGGKPLIRQLSIPAQPPDFKDTEMDIITRKALLPFVDARFETVGEKLCLRDGVVEPIQDWEKPYSSAPGPVQVVVIPSLIYRSDAQMAIGKIQEEDGGPHHAARLFIYYLDNKSYWMNGLSSLTLVYLMAMILREGIYFF